MFAGFLRSLRGEIASEPGREKYCMNHLSVWLRLSVAAWLRIVSLYIYKCTRIYVCVSSYVYGVSRELVRSLPRESRQQNSENSIEQRIRKFRRLSIF